MNRISRRVILLGVAWAALALPAASRAVVVLELDTGINGTFPDKVNNALPALKATFTDAGADTVTLKLDATNLTSGEYIHNWLFNFNGDATTLTFTPDSTPPQDGVQLSDPQALSGGNPVKAGLFNIEMDFNTANSGDRFNGGETLTVTITGTGITAADFNYASIDKPSPNGSTGGWLSAADIRGIGTAGGSGSIGTMNVAVVPEPSTVVLAAMGGVGLIGLRLRRRGRATV